MKNIKLIVASVVLSLVFTVSNAQWINFGPRFGVNISTIKGATGNDSLSTVKGKTTIPMGLFLVYGNNAHHKLSADFIYSPKGITYGYTAIKNDSVSIKYNSDLTFNYIEMPMQYTYCLFNDSNKLRVRLSAGMSFGVRLNANRHYESETSNTFVNKKKEIITYKSDFNPGASYTPVDFAAVAGVGVSYLMTKNIYINADVRFTRSIQNISEREVTDLPKVHNQTISAFIGAGWCF